MRIVVPAYGGRWLTEWWAQGPERRVPMHPSKSARRKGRGLPQPEWGLRKKDQCELVGQRQEGGKGEERHSMGGEQFAVNVIDVQKMRMLGRGAGQVVGTLWRLDFILWLWKGKG